MTYVVTHRVLPSTEDIRFVRESPADLVRNLKEQGGKSIWICGGASIAQQLLEAELVDRLHLSVIPTMLGAGIPLFGALRTEQKLKLLQVRSSNGIIEAIYEKRCFSPKWLLRLCEANLLYKQTKERDAIAGSAYAKEQWG